MLLFLGRVPCVELDEEPAAGHAEVAAHAGPPVERQRGRRAQPRQHHTLAHERVYRLQVVDADRHRLHQLLLGIVVIVVVVVVVVLPPMRRHAAAAAAVRRGQPDDVADLSEESE